MAAAGKKPHWVLNPLPLADEGTVSQMYTYADDTITWTYTDKDGEQISTFVKLTEEELAEYEARGIGNAPS